MNEIFPIDAKISFLRGVLSIIRENGGSASLSHITREALEGIDEIFPVIEAGKILGLITVDEGIVSLTDLAKNINHKELKKDLSELLKNVEPIKTLVEFLWKAHKASTEELFDVLLKKNLVTQINRDADIEKFRKEMIGLLVRTEICSYDSQKDSWKLSESKD